MEYGEWRALYERILADFGFSETGDRKAAALLSELLNGKLLASDGEIAALLCGRDVYVVGGACAPSDIEGIPTGAAIISADDATTVLMQKKVVPTIVATDLDGAVDDQVSASKYGAYTIIHAHGDNFDALRRHVPRFSGKLMGTTQSAPDGGLRNFGGFTDGDRAVLLAEEMGARRIFLVGFDFGNAAPKPGKDPARKLRKLAWARRLIKMVKRAEVMHHGKKLV
ncbi:MAG: DUF115 domain-containing protein [Euryarchaeota archaeon]|nr:DUF115 domain-containing protein [Euryarchaeota archaeon]